MKCRCGNIHMEGKSFTKPNDARSYVKCRPMAVRVVDMSQTNVRAKGLNTFVLGCRQCFDDFELQVRKDSVAVCAHQAEKGRRSSQPSVTQPLSACFPVSLRKFISEGLPVEEEAPVELANSKFAEDFGTMWTDECAIQPPSFSLADHVLLAEFSY